MGQVTSLFVRKVAGTAGPGVDRAALMRSTGVDPDADLDVGQMISDTDYYTFLEQLAAVDPDPVTIPLRAGAAMRCDDYGALGLAMKSAPTLRGTYDRPARYARVLTSVASYELEPTGEGAFMHLLRAGERRLGLRLSNEATVASLTSIAREVTTIPFTPRAVYFQHRPPVRITEHEAWFGCPVHFDADRDALLVSQESLDRPNRLGDTGLSRFFEQHLEREVFRFADEQALDERVRAEISRSLSGGIPRISEVAGQLGMSGRTLQRRLSEEGHSYQTLIDAARRQLALRLVRATGYALAEVAFLTGFSDQSAFTRAFKRWTGETPRAFRLEGRET